MKVSIVFVGESLPTGRLNRVWRYGYLADALVAAGHEVIRWAPSFSHVTKRQRPAPPAGTRFGNGYEVRLVPTSGYRSHVGPRRWWAYRQFAHRLAGCLASIEQPDLILGGLPTPEACRTITRYAAGRTTATVVDIRDLWPDVYLDVAPPLLRPIWSRVLGPAFRRTRQALARATSICAISRRYLEWGLEHAGRTATPMDSVFHIGYRRPAYSPEELRDADSFWEQRLGPGGDTFTCCYIGTMSRQCDLPSVIAAARVLEKRRPGRFRFVLCGNGVQLDRLRAEAAGVDSVDLPGWIDGARIQALMARAHVGLAPYVAGALMSLPNKPTEYLSAGLPVISSLVGELRDLIDAEGCGYSYTPASIGELTAILERLASDPEMQRSQSAAAGALFERRFDADRIYPSMVRHLENVVEASCQGPLLDAEPSGPGAGRSPHPTRARKGS